MVIVYYPYYYSYFFPYAQFFILIITLCLKIYPNFHIQNKKLSQNTKDDAINIANQSSNYSKEQNTKNVKVNKIKNESKVQKIISKWKNKYNEK